MTRTTEINDKPVGRTEPTQFDWYTVKISRSKATSIFRGAVYSASSRGKRRDDDDVLLRREIVLLRAPPRFRGDAESKTVTPSPVNSAVLGFRPRRPHRRTETYIALYYIVLQGWLELVIVACGSWLMSHFSETQKHWLTFRIIWVQLLS